MKKEETVDYNIKIIDYNNILKLKESGETND